jgi:hypothetical protein
MLAQYQGVTWTPELGQQLNNRWLSPEQRLQQPKLQADTEAAQVRNAVLSLAQAANRSPVEYQQLLSQQPKAVQQRFAALGPNPRFADVLQVGMTPGEARTAAHEQFLERQEGIRTGLALQEFQQKFGNPFQSATDADMLRYESILRGDSPMPSPRSAAGIKTANAVMALAAQRGDNYTDARYKTKQNFKTGGDSNNLVTLTTGLDHADLALKHSGDLGNSFSLLTGHTLSPEASRYTQDVQQLTGEIGKLVKGGMVTEGEHQALAKNLLSARQDVRDAALNETMQLLGGKVEGIQQKYRAGTGQDIPLEIYDKPTQDRMRRFGIGGLQGTAAGSAPAAPGVTPAKTVTSDQLQRYAAQKGIPASQAAQEFQQAGYALSR